MQSRHKYARLRLWRALRMVGLVVLVRAVLAGQGAPAAEGYEPGVSQPAYSQGLLPLAFSLWRTDAPSEDFVFQAHPTDLHGFLEPGQSPPPAASRVRRPEWAPEVYEADSPTSQPALLARRRFWRDSGQGAAIAPQQSWSLPPGVPLESLPMPIEPGPGVELIPTPDPIESMPGPVPYQWDDPANPWPLRFHPRDIVAPVAWALRTRRANCDKGIGYERVAMAPFIIDIAQPMNHFAFRVDLVDGWGLPDRAEALFARHGGKGPPAIERSVSFQDFDFISEVGTPTLSVRTLIPIRVLDPEVNAETAGLGDIQLATKTLLLDGEFWKLSQLNVVYFNTASAKKGLGTGHISMEPGLLATYKWTDETYLHGELRFLFPLAGDPDYQGNILRWGLGASHLLYDSDSFALIPTVELVFHSILDGMATDPVTGPRSVDGETVSTMHFGLRMVSDTARDFGLMELGISGGFNLGTTGWYDSLVRMELRIMY